MEDTLEQLKHFFRSFWENRWLALMAAALLATIGWVAVIVAPDRYEVTTRVYIDTRSMLKPLLKGIAVDSAVTESTAEIMKRTLLARPNLEAVARKAGMGKQIQSPESYEKMIKRLSEKIMISGGREVNNVYTISYMHRNPVMAKNIVQALLDQFIERVIGANRIDTDVTKKFLDEKIADYEIRLTSAEERLKEFKKEHPGVLANDDRTYFSRLDAMRTQLQTAKLDLQEQEHRRTALSQQLKSTPSHTSTGGGVIRGGGATGHPIDQSILAAQADIAGLLLKYSDAHPDVASAKRRLAQLESQKAAGVTGAVASTGATGAIRTAPMNVANPAYQTLKLAYGEADAMVAALNTRVKEYSKRVSEMEAAADTLPDIEARFTRLDRDYVVNKREYEELLKRRESADISEGVNNADELQFDVIDPPRVPLLPKGPNRLKWITLIFLLALGSGIGGAILLSMISPKIYSKKSIKQLTTLPVLGSVSQLNSVGNHLAKGAGNITYSLASGVLLLVYASIMMAYIFNIGSIRDYAGFSLEQMEEQLGDDVISPIKDAFDEI